MKYTASARKGSRSFAVAGRAGSAGGGRAQALAGGSAMRSSWAVIAVAVVLLALLAVWWWLVGRNARNVSAGTAPVVSDFQSAEAALDGINSFVDGIVLTDKGGMVQYANQAFARILGVRRRACGHGLRGDFYYDTALRLYKQLDVAIQSEQSFMFKDVMWLQSKKYHYQITCSPYRNESGVITRYGFGVPRHHAVCRCAGAQPAYGPADIAVLCTPSRPSIRIWAASPRGEWRTWAADLVTLGLSEEDEKASSARRLPACRRSARCSCPASCLTKPARLHAGRASGYGAACGICPGDLEEHSELPAEAISQMKRAGGRFRVSVPHGDEIGICGRILLGCESRLCALIRPLLAS